MPLCRAESVIIREDIIKKILEFDSLDEEAKLDFKMNIPGLNKLTAQQIEKIIKEDYETGSTSTVDSHGRDEMTPYAPQKRGEDDLLNKLIAKILFERCISNVQERMIMRKALLKMKYK